MRSCGVLLPVTSLPSPYQSFSAFAGNPLWIDLELLIEEGFLNKKMAKAVFWGANPEKVDYKIQFEQKYQLLKTVYLNFEQRNDMKAFLAFKKKERK